MARYHSCARRANREVECWGRDAEARPAQHDVRFRAGLDRLAGTAAACAATARRSAGATTRRARPRRRPVCSRAVDAGGTETNPGFNCGVGPTGAVLCWGDSSFGQLASVLDSDADGLEDAIDNCPNEANPNAARRATATASATPATTAARLPGQALQRGSVRPRPGRPRRHLRQLRRVVEPGPGGHRRRRRGRRLRAERAVPDEVGRGLQRRSDRRRLCARRRRSVHRERARRVDDELRSGFYEIRMDCSERRRRARVRAQDPEPGLLRHVARRRRSSAARPTSKTAGRSTATRRPTRLQRGPGVLVCDPRHHAGPGPETRSTSA